MARGEALAVVERAAFEAIQWSRLPENNPGADQPSLIFARRFAFLLTQDSRGAREREGLWWDYATKAGISQRHPVLADQCRLAFDAGWEARLGAD